MQNHLDVVFSPGLYLERDKRAIRFIEDRLLHQESCAAISMYGNGKDYLFTNVVKRMEAARQPCKLKVLNTVSADELRDFADMLERETEPTLCLVNLRVRKDVSWFVTVLDELRTKREYAFISFVCAYVGDVYRALATTQKPITHSLVALKLVPYKDAQHIINELSDRFGFYPDEQQKQDMYRWSYGHVGMLRTLYLLKRQTPGRLFSSDVLLGEATVLERLNNIIHDIPAQKLEALQKGRLSFVERVLYKEFGYIDADGALFHPLLQTMITQQPPSEQSSLSITENRVLEYLSSHADEIVSRHDVARIVWGEEEWEDKYSDWAIGQLIYRLRKKLAYSLVGGAIETRKGQGFAYHAASAGNSSRTLATVKAAASSRVL